MTARASAIAVVFVANGLGGPSFLPRLPERQADLGLSHAGLGVVLAGMAAGALAASPLAGRAVERAGSRPVVVAAALALAASLWTAGAAPGPVVLFAALAVVGAADAAMDIAMNANGSAYERRSGRSVLHRLHGAWSLGALGAAGLAATAAALDVPLTLHLVAVGAAIGVGVVAVRGGLVGGREPVPVATPAPPGPGAVAGTGPDPAAGHPGDPGGRRSRPDTPIAGGTAPRRRVGPLVVLAAATIGGAVIEGAPADWSAIRLERLGTGPGTAALGLAAFMAGMLVGRLVGDHLTDRFGGAAVLRGGMTLVAAGLLAGALVDHPAAFAVGLVLAGAGASALFPLAFSAAGTTPGVAPGTGAATVSLAARLGFLAEPVLMGALAELLGLRWAFVVVGGVALAIAAAASRIVPPVARPVDGTVTDVRAG
ncbi:MAG TPA: MFS transporter [Acidimicrobiales bacterium]|nr:MFS transporter [Acidimicrobiales bacterium]